jgi:endogenous inhibitor of DNA gyrase (YacG/DUF329 family)
MKRIYKATCPVCGVEVSGEDSGIIDDPGFIVICPHCGEMIEVEEERRR